jgi:hypothetical protein
MHPGLNWAINFLGRHDLHVLHQLTLSNDIVAVIWLVDEVQIVSV